MSIIRIKSQYIIVKISTIMCVSLLFIALYSFYMKNPEENDPDIMNYIKRIALWIRTERQNANLSQMDLSLKAGLSQNHVYAIETGQRFPNMYTFLKICKALNANPAKLFNPSSEERICDKKTIINLLNKHL